MERRDIKSYVIRSGRMGKGLKTALGNYLPSFGLEYSENSPLILEYAKNYEKLIVEIGFGMGEAFIELAQREPESLFIGLEVHPPGVGRVLKQAEERSLKNIRIIKHDAFSVLRDMFPPRIVDGFHIFFPDPWPKRRHNKRRLIQKEFLEILSERLKEGGYIYIVTDWKDYAEFILDQAGNLKILENQGMPYIKRLPWRPMTSFEQKAINKDNKIFEIYYIKRTVTN